MGSNPVTLPDTLHSDGSVVITATRRVMSDIGLAVEQLITEKI